MKQKVRQRKPLTKEQKIMRAARKFYRDNGPVVASKVLAQKDYLSPLVASAWRAATGKASTREMG